MFESCASLTKLGNMNSFINFGSSIIQTADVVHDFGDYLVSELSMKQYVASSVILPSASSLADTASRQNGGSNPAKSGIRDVRN